MKTSELTAKFPNLNRDKLYFWEKRGWISSGKAPGGNGRGRRDYSEEDVRKIGIMLECYAAGYTPEHAYRKACEPDVARTPDAQALSQAHVAMMKSILLDDPAAALDTVASIVHQNLRAECCSIFLVPEDSPYELELATNKGEKDFTPGKLRVPIRSTPRGGLTGHIASAGEVVRLNSAQLRNSPYVAGDSPTHLASGKCFSLAAIPLKDRKGRLLGLLKVENKKEANGVPSENAFFDQFDMATAEILAKNTVLVLESLRLYQTSLHLMEAMTTAASLPEYLNEVLQKGLRLLHADRGDIIWWEQSAKKTIVLAQIGESNLKVGDPMPQQSVVRHVFNTGQPVILSDVTLPNPHYYCCSKQTKSEMAIRLDLPERPVGVLNVESFKRNGFDEEDLGILRRLAKHVVVAAHMVGSRDAIYTRMVQQATEHSFHQEDILTSILRSVNLELGLDAGAIFIADHKNGVLRCAASHGCDKSIKLSEFTYIFDAPSFPSKIFRDKSPYFSEDPSTDASVAQKGLRAFNVQGPLVGAPLIFGNIVVGVLVCWSREGRRPTYEDKHLLQRFARLAVTTIAISETEKEQTATLEQVRTILAQMRSGAGLSSILEQILQGVLASGFERARVFEFKERPQHFFCLASLSIPKGMEAPGKYKKCIIELVNSPYAKLTSRIWKEEIAASIRNPAAKDGLGHDPYAEKLDKPKYLPWAVAPLVINGKLYGYLAADNRWTESPISARSLEYLTFIGAFAAQAIANARSDPGRSGSRNKS